MGRSFLSQAIEKLTHGAPDEAERLCRAGLQKSPRNIELTIVLGDALARLNRPDEAMAAYDRADRLEPGNALVFTRSATLGFRSRFGEPPAPRSSDRARPRIQMTKLGIKGRFGNQLLQYAFVRFYAQQHDLAAELPDWIGRDLFDLDDPFPSGMLPKVDESELDFFDSLNGRSGPILSERDITGYLCGSTALWGERAVAFRTLFAPGRKIRPLLDRAWTRLADAGRTVVAIHLRRKDFGYGGFWIAPVEWYLTWLRRIWPGLPDPVLYVATDTSSLMSLFGEFPCWDASKLGVDIPGADFMVDHYVLSRADHVAISNSTFSFTAAMLNTRARTFVRPHPNRRELVAFEPWSADVLLGVVVEAHKVPAPERLFLQQRYRVTGNVVHLGEYCAPWTFMARKRFPTLQVAELGSGAEIDRFRKNTGLRHIGLLFAGDRDALFQVVEGARYTLSRSRIDTLQFRIGHKQDSAAAVLELAGYGYATFRLTEDTPVRVEPGAPLDEGSYVAVHERLIPGFLGVAVSGLDIVELCRKHGVRLRGVVHVGAHEGQRLPLYEAAGAEPIVLIEANPAVYARLVGAAGGSRNVVTVNRAIADKAGTSKLHLASSDGSASLLPMTGYRNIHPQITPAGSIDVECATLDDLLSQLNLDGSRFNFLDIDAQGAEAMVLRGARALLRHVEAITVEVNFFDLQEDGAQIEEIDEILEGAGFRRAATLSVSTPSWSDAFYVRR